MPHSSHHALTAVMDTVVRLQPRSVLDVGVGYGKWGLLIREALDFMEGRHEREEFRVRIDGIEAFKGFSSPLYAWVYDNVSYADIAGAVDDLPPYDLVVLGDVIEHMAKQVGERVLEGLLAKSTNVVVVTPSEFFQQEVLGNPWERHESLWRRSDFARWPYDFQNVGITNVAVLGGRGSTWPAPRDARANDIAYRLPWVNRGWIRPAVAKQVVLAAMGARPSARRTATR
jgi:hypothetical protein